MTSHFTWKKVAKRIRVPMGFVVAALFLFLARPTIPTLLESLLLVLPGLLLRGYAAGYVRKNAELTTTGPYAHTRNPLYLGSMLIACGFGAAAGSWLLFLGLAGLFLAIYLPTIQGEEEFLRATFSEFAAYAAQVPKLIPRLTPARTTQPTGTFSRALYMHHREYNALVGTLAIYGALILKLIAR